MHWLLVLYIVRFLHVVKGAAQGLTRCAYSKHWADNYALKSLLQFFLLAYMLACECWHMTTL
jgi:hypothetical protein